MSSLARVGSWGINRPDGRRTASSASNKQELDIFVVRSDGEQLVFPADFFQRKLG